MAFTGVARRGLSHQYTPRLMAFEHTPNSTADQSQNLLIFIGGLFDGLHTVPYTSVLAKTLPPTWTIAQPLLSSSYSGWGISSLNKDVKELSECVAYFRTIKSGKIVLMGNSTGCQDIMHYLTGSGYENRAPIDGGILQAPASDREAITLGVSNPDLLKKWCETAQAMVAVGDGGEILPLKRTDGFYGFFPCPVTASRWLSLVSPNHDGDDDYFSSDLTDEQLMKSFGSLPARTPLCILFSGNDEYMSEDIDKMALTKRWIEIIKKGDGRVDEEHSSPLEGASHNLAKDSEKVVSGLVRQVLGFLDDLVPHSNL